MLELLSILILRRTGGKYLLVEDPASKLLRLPSRSSTLSTENDDSLSLAQYLLDNVLNIAAKFRGVLKVIQHNSPPGSANHPTLSVVLVADEIKPKTAEPLQSSSKDETHPSHHWFSGPEMTYKSIVIDQISQGLISQLENSCTIYPLELLETMEYNGVRKMRGLLEKQMLEEAGYNEYELNQIAEEFVKICGSPSAMINIQEFTELVEKLGWPSTHSIDCFRALQSNNECGGLILEELQLGLCAMDPVTPHGSIPGQLRCQFIFRYYNTSGKGFMSFDEFKAMYHDICVHKKISMGPDYDQTVLDNWRNFGITESHGLSLSKFLTVVGQLKFRGTSVLFRLPHSPVKHQTDPFTNPQRPSCPSPCPSPVHMNLKTEQEPRPNEVEQQRNESEEEEEENFMEISYAHDPTNTTTVTGILGYHPVSSKTSHYTKQDSADNGFTIATHSVKVRRSGALADVSTLWELVGTDAVSGSVQEILDQHKPSFDRLPSIRAFDKASKSSEMLSGLRYFEHALRDDGRGKAKIGFSWGAIDMASVARCFLNICSQAVDVFANENRLLTVKSPCYVLGDLHGNFHDLICFEKVLWRMGPVLTPASFMFLGDYVDRGEYGFEVISYLFAQKLLMPSKFFLIRGNHEIRSVQESFTYKSECIDKFGPDLGEDVWEATNTVFDAMPIAAVIDNKVFCVHGGIPHPNHGGGYITAINDIPNHLPNPVDDSPLAWDIMWNDPVKKEEEENDESLKEELKQSGFIDNDSRGTGHLFSSTALQQFLKRNNLSHVIRAHEVKETGFQLQQNGRLLTVFSSSHYCGSTNEAACVLVDDRKIRTIRLDTRS